MGAINSKDEFMVSRSGCLRSPCCPCWLLEEAPCAFPTVIEPIQQRGAHWVVGCGATLPRPKLPWEVAGWAAAQFPALPLPSFLFFIKTHRLVIPVVAMQGGEGRRRDNE